MNHSNPEKVVAVLRDKRPAALCDDCIAHLAQITNRIAVNPIAAALGLTSDFSRETGKCARCQGTKLVTRSIR